MTNAVDILLVDGPAHARVICAKRPVAASYEVDAVQYMHREYTDLDGRMFHVALPADSTVGDGYIDGTIFVTSFPPAWDLRPDPPISGVKP